MATESLTKAQLEAAGYTVEMYERRNRIWHQMLMGVEPDERERINADPTGPEGHALSVSVELHAMAEEVDCRGLSGEQVVEKWDKWYAEHGPKNHHNAAG